MPGCTEYLGVEPHVALQFVLLIKVEEVLLDFSAVGKKGGPIWIWFERETVLVGWYITPNVFQPVLAIFISNIGAGGGLRNTRVCVLKPSSAYLCISRNTSQFLRSLALRMKS